MRLRSALAVLALVLIAGGCSIASSTPTLSPEAAFCDSLKDYAVAVVDLQALDDQNTIDEYKAAAQDVNEAMEAVVAAGVVMGEASVDELQGATDALVGTLTDLPQDTPVAQVRAELQAQLVAVAQARLSIGVAHCETPASASPAPATAAPAAS